MCVCRKCVSFPYSGTSTPLIFLPKSVYIDCEFKLWHNTSLVKSITRAPICSHLSPCITIFQNLSLKLVGEHVKNKMWTSSMVTESNIVGCWDFPSDADQPMYLTWWTVRGAVAMKIAHTIALLSANCIRLSPHHLFYLSFNSILSFFVK